MSRLRSRLLAIGAVVVTAAVGIGWIAAGDDGEAPYIEAKPDPMPGVRGAERPGFIRANEECEDHPRRSFEDGEFGFTTRVALDGLDSPTVLEFFDDDLAFIGQREGMVLLWDRSSGTAEPVIDLSAMTGTEQDQGLIGLAVTPDRRHLLINFTTEDESKVVAQPLVDGVPSVTGRVDVLTVEQPSTQHNGGTLTFDADGYLWASFGDGGGQGDRYANAQDPTTPLGSILRLDLAPDLSVSGAPGNPYLDGADGHPWVFATGIRNPYRFSIDPVTGELWIADVGQACVEEISVLDPATDVAANLGWSVFEGNRPFLGELDGAHHEPVFTYWRDGGFCAVVGGEVYRGGVLDALDGLYVFSDYCRSEILVFDRQTGIGSLTGVEVDAPLDVTVGPGGDLFVVSMSGSIVELIPLR